MTPPPLSLCVCVCVCVCVCFPPLLCAGPAIGATNGLMPLDVVEAGSPDTFIAWACSSDSVITPWIIRVHQWFEAKSSD